MKLNKPATKDQSIFNALDTAFRAHNYPVILTQAPDFLKKHPDHAPVLNMLAVALAQTGRKNEALAYMKRVVALVPHELVAQMNLARTYMELGDKFSAQEVYLKILERWPNSVEALASYGALLNEAGKRSDAESLFSRGLQFSPDAFVLKFNLASLCFSENRWDEALSIYQELRQLDPSEQIILPLAESLNKLGRLEQAIALLQESENIHAVSVKANILLAKFYAELNNVELAEFYFKQSLLLDEKDPLALFFYADFLRDQNQCETAILNYCKAIEFSPNNPAIWLNLGNVLRDQGSLDEALSCFNKMLALEPRNVIFLGILANHYRLMRRFEQSEATYQLALGYDPNHLMLKSDFFYLADWFYSPLSFQKTDDDKLNQLRTDKIAYGLEMHRRAMGLAFAEWRCASDPKALRVGLVSGDLRDHPVGYFLESMLVQMDAESRSRIEFIAYANTATQDDLSERIAPFFSTWRNITTLDDHAVAGLIHQDGIHVLIDLTGHTAKNRLGLFAYRPAPVQVSWLGYFASTGLHEMDYLLTDPWAIPDGSSQYFSETLWPLPKTRLCFTPPRFDLQVNNLPALQNGYITFGCFNQAVKLTDTVLLTWADMLKAVPNSRLLLKTRAFGSATEQDKVRAQFSGLGVAPERILLEGAGTREEYLACFNRVDISLDPFPYTGGTTTVESLWMGVPVLTLAGQTMVARQGVGLLMNAGLPDWVATSRENYLARAVARCADLPALAALREGLRARVLASPIFDGQGFARDFTQTLHALWQHHQSAPRKQPELPPYWIDSSWTGTVHLVSATQLSEDDFWAKSALGQSLPYHLSCDARIKPCIAFSNTRGLPEVFNEAIAQAADDDILVFMHDDVWIDELDAFTEALREGLSQFDVLGVAGNRRRVPNQPAWGFLDLKLRPDASEFLSGQIAHGDRPYGETSYFGEVPAACELLDGVFLATQKNRLNKRKVRFDKRFDFHLYDLDFCRTARKAGLTLGTWRIRLTHQSKGNYFSRHWHSKSKLYLKKWGS
jgi:predicted O-linked N-acetylglucosamine transferase (SPINDLY family)